LGLQIQPLFIFDGPHKPPFKRGKKTGHGGAMVPNLLTKHLLKLFGYAFLTAPGEAEAECALLQRAGIVDAVLSEDVDTLMFGCGLTLRNWSSENFRGNKSPTHVSAYDAVKTKEGRSGLDREGMILVALMSGGDYITEGIPGCGPKVACEASRAGFGHSLCQISDAAGLDLWRKNLAHEIQTNESKFFRIKHKALKIPEDFPNREVLSYYTHPVVSSSSKLTKIQTEIKWDQEVDVPGLRLFVAEAFEWTSIVGAKKFIRTIAPVLLIHKLRLRASRRASGFGDVILTAMNEMELVRGICGKRTHISSDGIPELRVIYHPLDIVGINLDAEPDDSEDYGRDGLAPVGDGDQIAWFQSDDDEESAPPAKRGPSQYDPTLPDKLWIPETMAKIGVPLVVEDWERAQRDPKEFLKQKAVVKRLAARGSKVSKMTKQTIQKGAMDRFVKVSRPGTSIIEKETSVERTGLDEEDLPPAFLAPSLEDFPIGQHTLDEPHPAFARAKTTEVLEIGAAASKSKPSSKPRTRSTKGKPLPNANPWTLSSSTATGTAVTKPLGNHPFQGKLRSPAPPRFRSHPRAIDLTSSSPPATLSRSSPPIRNSSTSSRKHRQSSTLSDDEPSILPNTIKEGFYQLPPRKKVSPSSVRKNNVQLSPELPSVSRLLEFGLPDATASPNVNVRTRSRRGIGAPASTNHSNNVQPDTNATSSSNKPNTKTPLRKTSIISLSSSPSPIPEDPFTAPSSSPLSSPPPELSSQSVEVSAPSMILKSTSKAKAKPKKFIVLRESLPGGWKELDEEEAEVELVMKAEKEGKGKDRGSTAAGRRGEERERRRWRMSEIEVLDLVDE
jgi:Holliday junction resolvase YEN1